MCDYKKYQKNLSLLDFIWMWRGAIFMLFYVKCHRYPKSILHIIWMEIKNIFSYLVLNYKSCFLFSETEMITFGKTTVWHGFIVFLLQRCLPCGQTKNSAHLEQHHSSTSSWHNSMTKVKRFHNQGERKWTHNATDIICDFIWCRTDGTFYLLLPW